MKPELVLEGREFDSYASRTRIEFKLNAYFGYIHIADKDIIN